jgi:hypothetical protein
MIPQRDLSLLSNRLAEQGGRRIPETVLERDYCLSWFLVGLTRSPLRDRLAFKGHVRLADLLEAVVQKLEFRSVTLVQVDEEFSAKEARYRKLWQVRLAAQMAELPAFDTVYRTVKRAFRQAHISRRET